MLDRRKEQRRRVYFGGRIISDTRDQAADCIVRDHSARGAKLSLHQAAFLPDEFALQVPRQQSEVRVKTRWRRLGEIGVELASEQVSDTLDAQAVAARLRRLESKSRTLRRRLAALTR
jgi:hypothetical protein